jgi:CDP-alcohol phosphatidyltransferase
MARNRPGPLVIDARPRGPRGPFALDRVQGRLVLDHLLDLADATTDPAGEITVVAAESLQVHVLEALAARPSSRFVVTDAEPRESAAVLRTDRLYDERKLARTLRNGGDPESAVFWRLDRPHALTGADDELTRRRTYQPLGRFWALEPARWLARALAPTPVRPNAVTLAASSLFLGASALVACGGNDLIAASGLALALVLDTADGHLARLQGTASAFGRWLDSWLDEVGDMALHAAIAWSAYARSGAVGWLLLGMLYAMGKYVFIVGTTEPDAATKDTTGPETLTVPPGFPVRMVRLAGHADVRWHLWIVLAACGRLDAALAIYAVYFPARAMIVAARKAVRRG